LSDEIEYLLPLLPLLAACTVFLMDQYRLAGILSLVTLVSVALTGLISVPLLARSDPWLPEPSPSIGLGWGAWRQDLATRSAAGTRSSDEYQDFLVRSLGPLEEAVASGQAALMPRDSWHYVRNAGYRSYYEDMTYVIGCRELTTEVLIPPWRVSQPMGDFNDVSAFEQGQLLRCERVAQLLPDRIEPINEGRTAGSDASYPR
jgi:hypothetical protein